MRRFVTTCIDEKTRYTMVLSEVSFNMAMDWLQREAEKYGKEIYRHEKHINGLDCLWVGRFEIDGSLGQYHDTVMFYYDESRGYLMQE